MGLDGAPGKRQVDALALGSCFTAGTYWYLALSNAANAS